VIIRQFDKKDFAAVKVIYQQGIDTGNATFEQAQGNGVGHKLLSQLVLESENHNIWMLQAGIFPENIGSIVLHEKNGFHQLGIREKLGKMNDVWRDLVFMQRRSEIVGISSN
jgi:phosphinothricin acetyltransferase